MASRDLYIGRTKRVKIPTHINSLSTPAAHRRETVAFTSTNGKQDNGVSLFSGQCG